MVAVLILITFTDFRKKPNFFYFDDIRNITFVFLTIKVPFFSYISNILHFFTEIRRKYAIGVSI